MIGFFPTQECGIFVQESKMWDLSHFESKSVATGSCSHTNLWHPKAIVTRSSRSLSTAWCATRSDAIFWVWRWHVLLIPSIIMLPMLWKRRIHVVFFSDFAIESDWILRNKWSEVVKMVAKNGEVSEMPNIESRHQLGINPPFKDATTRITSFPLTSRGIWHESLILGATSSMLRMLRYIVLQATHILFVDQSQWYQHQKLVHIECPCMRWDTDTHPRITYIYIHI